MQNLYALSEATREIGLSHDLDPLLDRVLERAQELIGFDHCALMLYDEERATLTVKRVRGYGDRSGQVLGLTLARGEGLSGWACERRRSVRVNDVRRDARYVPGLEACRSNLAVPLLVGGEVVGVINVESERLDAFTEEHEALLTVLGSQAALAIRAQQNRDRLQQRLDQLNALYRISQLASGHDDLDTTLLSILQVTEELVPEGQIAVLLVEEGGTGLVVKASRGYSEGVDGMRIPMGEGVTGRCARTGRMVVVEDLRQEDEYIPGVEGACCEIALPLTVEGRVIGILNLEARTPRAYREDHLRVLRVIAQQAAVVIRSAQLHEEARRLAVTDPLTGLHNRRHFLKKLDEHLRRAGRYGVPLALLMVDADCLKRINDRYGHLVGDRALIFLGDALRTTFRDTDELARIGGDEFAALLMDADRERATRVAGRLQEALGDLSVRTDAGDVLSLTCSVGVALYPQHGVDSEALLRQADLALYDAKRRGRGEVTVKFAAQGGLLPEESGLPPAAGGRA